GVRCIVSKEDELSNLLPAVQHAHNNSQHFSPRIEALIKTAGYGRRGLRALTGREVYVVRLYLSGLTINEIAQRLNRSKKTISSQKVAAMYKLGLRCDIELLRYGMEAGLTDA
ncbi:response regulator transcription factor, partial [Achromobacter sp. Marseille-Q0513]|uniref:LuxR C-terminal-related transcriptional regulator n=1 Tax=Achromobacter sp. Marseille-Q0513 TaxID=2829161 RepID=UPI001B971D67